MQVLAEEKRPLADVLFLQRFHRWAGHIARSPHEPLRQLLNYRDGAWWHQQHLLPWGIRHDGDRGNLQRRDQCLIDLHGPDWKGKAAHRPAWRKSEPDFLLRFQKPTRRPREQSNRQPPTDQRASEVRDCQVPWKVCTRGITAPEGKTTEEQGTKQVPLTVSTLKEQFKRKYTRQGDLLKEYLVPLGTSDECALGRTPCQKVKNRLAREITRRKSSSTWSRAIQAVHPEEPLIDLVIQPLAGRFQGGHDIFGVRSGLGRGAGGQRGTGRTKSCRAAGGSDLTPPRKQRPKRQQEEGRRRRSSSRRPGMQSWTSPLDDYIKQCKPHLMHVRDSDEESNGRQLEEVPAGIASAEAEPAAETQEDSGTAGGGASRRAWASWEESSQKRRKRTAEEAMEGLEGSSAAHKSLQGRGSH